MSPTEVMALTIRMSEGSTCKDKRILAISKKEYFIFKLFERMGFSSFDKALFCAYYKGVSFCSRLCSTFLEHLILINPLLLFSFGERRDSDSSMQIPVESADPIFTTYENMRETNKSPTRGDPFRTMDARSGSTRKKSPINRYKNYVAAHQPTGIPRSGSKQANKKGPLYERIIEKILTKEDQHNSSNIQNTNPNQTNDSFAYSKADSPKRIKTATNEIRSSSLRK